MRGTLIGAAVDGLSSLRGSVSGVLGGVPTWASSADPTGLSSPVGKVAILAGLLAALLVLIMQWRRRR